MNWKKVKLTDVCDFQGGTQPPADEFITQQNEGYVRLLQIRDFASDNNAVYIVDSERWKKCDEDDVCIARYGASIGRILRGKAGAYNVAIVKTIPNAKILSKDFIFWALNSNSFQSFIQSNGSRAAQAGFNKEDLARYEIPLPDLKTQQHIAQVLDKADALRQQNQQLLATYDELLQSTFIELFGDPVKNPKGWEEVVLNEVAAKDGIKCGPFGSQLHAEEFQESGVPLWGIRQVNKYFKIPTKEFLTEKKANQLKTYSILPFDIIMTRKGTIGNCAIYPKNFPNGIMHSDILRIRVDEEKCVPIFMSTQLRFSEDIVHQISLISAGAIMAGINVGKLKKIIVQLPPLPLQEHFAKIVEQIEVQKAMAKQSLQESIALFEGLLAAYFG